MKFHIISRASSVALLAMLAVAILVRTADAAEGASGEAENAQARQRSICGSDVVAKAQQGSLGETLPPLAERDMTAAQLEAAKSISAGPRGCVFGPFSVLLRSPELLERTQRLGEFLRFRSALPKRLSELAILVCGREWQQPYVWFVHEPIARSEGIAPKVIAAIAQDMRPDDLSTDEQIIYDFSEQLLRTRKVTDEVFEKVRTRFGEGGVVELTAIHGYFALLAMEMNVARTPLPPGATEPFVDINDSKDSPGPKGTSQTQGQSASGAAARN